MLATTRKAVTAAAATALMLLVAQPAPLATSAKQLTGHPRPNVVRHIVSDSSWVYSEQEADDWNALRFDDSSWLKVVAPSAGLCDPAIVGHLSDSDAVPIWGREPEDFQRLFLRREFRARPGPAVVRTLIDDDMSLFLNGKLVRKDYDGQATEFRDDVHLRGGRNVIAVEAVDTAGGCQHLNLDLEITKESHKPSR